MASLVPILVLTVFVALFGSALLMVISLLGPKSAPSPVKSMPYECGVPGQESPKTQISVKFYLTAILFILFDIEIIFMYPWAITFSDFKQAGFGTYIFVSMMVFVALFVFGLFWEVKSKALEWE